LHRQKDRERNIFSNELPYLLRSVYDEIILGGDFNCVLEAAVSTGYGNFSRSLATPIQGYALRDACQAHSSRRIYTPYTVRSVSRLDRIYLTTDLMDRKKGLKTIAEAFTDHFAVSLRISLNAPIVRRGRGTWKLNTDILATKHVIENLRNTGHVGNGNRNGTPL